MVGCNPIRVSAGFLILVLAAAGLSAQNRGPVRSEERVDPPGFGSVHLKANHTIRLNVTCFGHEVGRDPAGPCRGAVMFHDAAGEVLREGRYDLKPGQSTFVQFTFASRDDRARIRAIVPGIIPEPGGRAIPTVEVFDEAGRLRLFENPASPRMSAFNNDFTNPGAIAGFNPQPDPPGFGIVTLTAGQMIRLNVACFDHPINGQPPDSCRGEVMLHNRAGDVLRRGAYALRPGQAVTFGFQVEDRIAPVGILPCILPERGSRAVPNLEIVDVSTGDTMFLINPAAAQMSQFQKQ